VRKVTLVEAIFVAGISGALREGPGGRVISNRTPNYLSTHIVAGTSTVGGTGHKDHAFNICTRAVFKRQTRRPGLAKTNLSHRRVRDFDHAPGPRICEVAAKVAIDPVTTLNTVSRQIVVGSSGGNLQCGAVLVVRQIASIQAVDISIVG